MNRYTELLKKLQDLTDEQIDKLLYEINNLEATSDNNKQINIENILKKLYVNPKLLGYTYLKEAIEMCLINPNLFQEITKTLYPSIAKKYETTGTKVERAIRHAIEASWNKIDEESYSKVFFNNIEKPSNSTYIAYVCSYIKTFDNSKETKHIKRLKIEH